MSPVERLSLIAAALLLMGRLAELGRSPRCLSCGGKGGHRPDCPQRRGPGAAA